jgi:hypothetical protein
MHRYTRVSSHRWRLDVDHKGAVEFDVDDHGLVLDYPAGFRRAS